MLGAKQIVGWLLVALGLGLIFWGLWTSFEVFSGKAAAPEIFRAEQSQSPAAAKGSSLEAQAQEVFDQALQEQFKSFLPPGSIPELLNLLSWSIFAGILMWGGGQVAGIGVKLLAIK